MLKNDEIDYCTKCTERPIVKNHMCLKCENEMNEWLKELPESKKTDDDDDWITLYESDPGNIKDIQIELDA